MTKWLIIWDWDNTLSDTFEALYDAHIDLCDKYGKRRVTHAEVLSAICGEGGAFWTELFHDVDYTERSDLYYQQSAIRLRQKAGLMKDALKILDWIKDQKIPQIVISNQKQWILDIECERLRVAAYFERIVGRTDVLKKPHSEYLDRALKGLDFDKCIVIGDGLPDMETAKNLKGFGLYVCNWLPRPEIPYDKHVEDLTEAMIFLQNFIRAEH